MPIDPEIAKKFFASLYKDDVAAKPGAFERMASRISTTHGEAVATGDKALQNLMFTYILSSPENVEKGRDLAAVLGNIQRAAVEKFAKTFPNADLKTLMAAAKDAGYDVDVIA